MAGLCDRTAVFWHNLVLTGYCFYATYVYIQVLQWVQFRAQEKCSAWLISTLTTGTKLRNAKSNKS